MNRFTSLSLVLFILPLALAAQQPTAPPAARPATPHDSVRGAVRAVDLQARTVEVTTGVGFAIRVVKLQVPADVPITNRQGGQSATLQLAELKPGDVIRATFGGRPTGLVAYVIERVGRMEAGATP